MPRSPRRVPEVSASAAIKIVHELIDQRWKEAPKYFQVAAPLKRTVTQYSKEIAEHFSQLNLKVVTIEERESYTGKRRATMNFLCTKS